MKGLWCALLMLLGGAVYAADMDDVTVTSGTVTVAIDDRDEAERRSAIMEMRFTWAADTGGNVVALTGDIFGVILKVITNPAADAPDDNYDITLADEDGWDVLVNKGINRDTANTEAFVPLIGDGATTAGLVSVAGPLTLTISGAGSTNDGDLVLHILRENP